MYVYECLTMYLIKVDIIVDIKVDIILVQNNCFVIN